MICFTFDSKLNLGTSILDTSTDTKPKSYICLINPNLVVETTDMSDNFQLDLGRTTIYEQDEIMSENYSHVIYSKFDASRSIVLTDCQIKSKNTTGEFRVLATYTLIDFERKRYLNILSKNYLLPVNFRNFLRWRGLSAPDKPFTKETMDLFQHGQLISRAMPMFAVPRSRILHAEEYFLVRNGDTYNALNKLSKFASRHEAVVCAVYLLGSYYFLSNYLELLKTIYRRLDPERYKENSRELYTGLKSITSDRKKFLEAINIILTHILISYEIIQESKKKKISEELIKETVNVILKMFVSSLTMFYIAGHKILAGIKQLGFERMDSPYIEKLKEFLAVFDETSYNEPNKFKVIIVEYGFLEYR